MKRKDIHSWLSGVPEQNPTPPATPPANIDGGHDTKRQKMSQRGKSTSRKRRIQDDTTSSITDLTERTRFDPSIQSSSGTSRQRSPVRDLLNELPLSSPSIHCTRPKSVPLPDSVRSLRQVLGLDFGVKLIPAPLKDKIRSEAPDEAIDIPDAAFYDAVNATPDELNALWLDVTEIYNEAAEAEEHGQDENSWGTGVVQAILRRGVKRHPILQWKNVQTQSIDPGLLPRLPHKNAVSKKVDYTFAFSIRDPQVKDIYNDFWNTFPDQTVSQTTDPFTKRVALFSGIEVKQSNGGNTEALVQLAIWLAAGLEKLSRLQGLHGEKSDSRALLPAIGWTVIGHDWNLYIAFRGCFEGQDRIYVDGPVESLSASTRTYYGIFKLIDLVRRLSSYAEEVYWPWMKSEILTPPADTDRGM